MFDFSLNTILDSILLFGVQGKINLFEIGPTTVVQALNFIILYFILSKFLWKPIMSIIEERQRHITESIRAAEDVKEEAHALKARYQGMLENAGKEAQKKIYEATNYAEKVKADIIADAKEEAARVVKMAEQDVVLEKQKALSEIKTHIASLAVITAGQVLKDSLDPASHEKLMQDVVRRVGERHVN